MSDARLREMERLHAAGEIDGRTYLAAADRARPPLLPAPSCWTGLVDPGPFGPPAAMVLARELVTGTRLLVRARPRIHIDRMWLNYPWVDPMREAEAAALSVERKVDYPARGVSLLHTIRRDLEHLDEILGRRLADLWREP